MFEVRGVTCHTGCPRGPGLYHAVAAVTLEHDLPPVLDLPHVGPESDGHIRDLNEIQNFKIRPITFNRMIKLLTHFRLTNINKTNKTDSHY